MMARFLMVLLTTALLFSSLSSRAAEELDDASSVVFARTFKGVKRDSRFYLLKLDDCKVAAYRFSSSIPFIIVQSNKRDKALSTAEHIVKVFPVRGAQIIPFAKNTPCVAITFPMQETMWDHAPLRLLFPEGVQPIKETCQFIDWNINGELTFRVEARALSNSSKKNKATFDISCNMNQTRVENAELRLVKGRIEDDDICSFVCERLHMSTYSTTTYASSSYKAQLRKSFSGAEVLLYSSSSNFCIVYKRKTYHAGTLSGVREALRSHSKPAKLNYPTDNLPWPDEVQNAADTSQEQVTESTEHIQEEENTPSEPSTAPEPQERPSQERPSAPTPQPKKIQNQQQAIEEYLNLLRKL